MPEPRADSEYHGEHKDILDLSEPISVHREQPDDAELENIPERFLIMKYAHDEISSQICFQKKSQSYQTRVNKIFFKVQLLQVPFKFNSICSIKLSLAIFCMILFSSDINLNVFIFGEERLLGERRSVHLYK